MDHLKLNKFKLNNKHYLLYRDVLRLEKKKD